ncbi:MAG: CocE/NonD family hydrolase C-terminal non-catalytic domain-containing protein, partial [Pseudomonadota bacterium]
MASPQNTGAAGGEYCAIWLGPEMPGDQRPDDARSACWDTPPLGENNSIVGRPIVTLKLRAEAAQGQIAVRLNHVHPDGASTRITYGVLNLSHRDSAAMPEPMPLDTDVTVTVKLDEIAYSVPEGHRLRVAVSTAYWPLIWPTPLKCGVT